MKGEHKRFELPLKSILTPIGFEEVVNDDYSVVLENEAGWRISVDSERYYEGVFRWIIAPDGFSYSAFMLVSVFEKVTDQKFELTNFDDWIKFICQNKTWIFRDPQPYRSRYKELDQ